MDLNIDNMVKELNSMEEEGDDETDWDGERWKDLNSEFWKALHIKESLLAQKAREKWIQQGDGNNRLGRSGYILRQRRNQIEMIKVEDKWLNEVDEV